MIIITRFSCLVARFVGTVFSFYTAPVLLWEIYFNLNLLLVWHKDISATSKIAMLGIQ